MLDPLLQEGLQLHQAGRLAEAETRYRQLLARDSRHPDALHYLGLLAYQRQQYEAAARLIGESIAEKGDDPTAHSNYGNALTRLGRLDAAEAAFRSALALDPRFADAWFNLANVLREQHRFGDADAAYRRVIELKPDHAGAFNNLANLLLLEGRSEEASETFVHLGDILQEIGRTGDAENAYRQAQASWPGPVPDVKLAFLTPVIPSSGAEIDATREHLRAGLARLAARGIALPDPLRGASNAVFYTGYHGRNDRELRKAFADFYVGAHPALAWRAPHCDGYAGAGDRIRIGFISRFFLPEHPMSKLFGGIVESLDRRHFDVSIFRFDPPEGNPTFGDSRTTVLPDDLDAARRVIADARLDVLFYTDIGMEPTTYFLAFARLATVQCTTFGHPVTTGIANVDYFLSAHDLETPDAHDHYTETLIRLPVVPTYFRRPAVAAAPPTRAELNLPQDARLYFCAQNLIKYHPDFDAVMGEILRRDPAGVLALINSARSQQLGTLVLDRFRRTIPDVTDRIVFLPFLNLDSLLGFLQYVDAVLDTPVFSGGTTSLEMFAVDTPIVTWPGAFARSRITHALYHQMQIDGLAARDARDYVEIAIRLANDPAWRGELRRELQAKKGVLYENSAIVRELERFFRAAVSAAATGHKLQAWRG
jgi:protein O-GlcNAc transferase